MCTSRPPTAANCCSPDIPNLMPSCAQTRVASAVATQNHHRADCSATPAVVKTFERPRTETQRLKPLKMPEPAKSGQEPLSARHEINARFGHEDLVRWCSSTRRGAQHV